MTTAIIRPLGGSLMLTLPRKLLDAAGLRAGSQVEITVDNGRLILSPVAKPKYHLADLLAQCEGDEFIPDTAWLEAPSVDKEAL